MSDPVYDVPFPQKPADVEALLVNLALLAAVDAREGLAAFAEKRQPQWQAR